MGQLARMAATDKPGGVDVLVLRAYGLLVRVPFWKGRDEMYFDG